MTKEKRGRKKSFSFEDAIERLEKIVAGLESGDLSLEQSLRTFEEGVGLVRQCRSCLESSRQRIEILLGEEGGKVLIDSYEEDVDDDDEGADA